jgi:hypothetical protein
MNRQRLFLLLVAAVLIAASYAIYDNVRNAAQNENSQLTNENVITENQSNGDAVFVNQSVRPPLENVSVPFYVHRIQPNKVQTISYPNGSSMVIPANAFVDEFGNLIKEVVEIHYREFHHAEDLIASGIPMRVKGANGQEEWMQTAGMFEMRGFAADKPIFVAEGKSIEVNMASEVQGDYPFWSYNEDSNNWQQIGSAGTTPMANQQQNTVPSTAKLVLPSKPVAYERPLALNINLDYNSFPALTGHEKTIWQYADTDESKKPNHNKWIQNEIWIDIQLEKTSTDDQYILTLTSDTAVYSVRVVPALQGGDYKIAMAKYQQKLAEYQAILNTEIVKEQANQFLRSYKVSGFGIYNYDVIYNSESRIPVYADFQIEGDPSKFAQYTKQAVVFLITADTRTVVSYDCTNWNKFSINPNDDNELVVLLPGNQIAKMSTAAFDAQRNSIKSAAGEKYTFVLELQEDPVTSLEDLKMGL